MQLSVVREEQMAADLDRRIREALCVCFPAERDVFLHTRAWHGSAPAWSVLAEDSQQRVVAHVGIVDRTIAAGDEQLRIAGVQNVFVLPEYRGQGWCDRLMNKMAVESERQQYDCGLLFCVNQLCKVYGRSGWMALNEKKILCTNEHGETVSLSSGNIAMFLPLSAACFPEGIIHLQGNDW